MKYPLLRYYSQDLSTWIYLAPLVYTLIGLLLLFEGLEIAVYFILTLCVTSICAIYFDKREKELLMTSLFPLTHKNFVMTDFIFIGRIIFGYYIYSLVISIGLASLYHNSFVLPSSRQIILCAGICCFITALFFIVRYVPFRAYINFSLFFLPFIFIYCIRWIKTLSIGYSWLFFSLSAVLFIVAFVISYIYRERRDIV